MPQVYIGVGSNIQREYYIRAGVEALLRQFGEIRCSPVYDTEPVGFKGDNFFNLVVSFNSELSAHEIDTCLTVIEDGFQRTRTSANKFCSRTLDLDLLLYGDSVMRGVLQLPRMDVYEHVYVLKPLLDLASDLRDPVSGRMFAEIAEEVMHPLAPMVQQSSFCPLC